MFDALKLPLSQTVKEDAKPWLVALLFLYGVALIVSTAAMEILAWVFFAIALVFLIRDVKSGAFRSSQVKLGCEFWLGGMLVSAILAVFVSPRPFLVDSIGFYRWILLLYAFSYLLKTRLLNSILYLFAGIFIATAYANFTLIFQFFLGFDFVRPYEILDVFGEHYFRPRGTFNMSLTTAYVLGQVALFAASLLAVPQIRNLKVFRRISIIAVVSSSMGVVLTLARAAWLGLSVGFVGMAMKTSRRTAIAIATSIVVGFGALFFISSGFREKISSFGDPNYESNHMRLQIWRANVEIIKDHPILGVGLKINDDLVPEYYQKLKMYDATFTGHAHNNFLQMAAGTGLIGLFFFVGLSLFFIVRSWKLANHSETELIAKLSLGLFFSQLFFHIGGLTECNFTDVEVTHMLVVSWFCISAFSFQNDLKANRPERHI